MTKTKKLEGICRRLLLIAICLVTVLPFLRINALAASAYEVTKADGALVRTSYSEKATSVRRATQGSIIWVVSSKRNSAGNLWYQRWRYLACSVADVLQWVDDHQD